MIKFPADEPAIKLLWIDASQNRAKPIREHGAGQRCGVRFGAPNWKQWFRSRAGKLPFAIGSDVSEKQIAECEARHTFRLGPLDELPHSFFVLRVAARPRQHNRPQWHARGSGLRFD